MHKKVFKLVWPLLIMFVLLLFSIGATTNDVQPKQYRITTDVHTINGKIWVFETKYNIYTGKVISRKQVKSTKYRNIQ
tara:strand:- start:2018 stop:2251 length:234 start_codon:yes stop_codon:yes gene_type:complete